MIGEVLRELREMKAMMAKTAADAKEEKEDMRMEIQEAARKAERAAEAASQAKEATAALKAAVDKIKGGAISEDALEKAVEKVMDKKWPVLGQSAAGTGGGGKGSGKFGGKGASDADKKRRTIRFGKYADETKAETIKKHLGDVVGEREDVEEIFAYGKVFALWGGVRFKTVDAMWQYMTANAGDHRHDFEAGVVQAKPYKEGGDSDCDKAVKKLTRAIIEEVGGDGKTVRKNIDPDYRSGIVRYQEKGEWSKIGEWDKIAMSIKPASERFVVRFRNLMAATEA